MPGNKSLKKKESKEDGSPYSGIPQVATEDQRKPIIPPWLEWSDQDILNEKWDPSKKDKEKVRSSSAQVNFFDDPEGKVLLPPSLNLQVKSWKRPSDIITGKTAVIVDSEFDHIGDLLIKNGHIVQDKVMNAIISCISVVSSYFCQAQFNETSSSSLKLKSSLVKEQTNTKADKIRKENEIKDEHFCNPWDLIWPKENPKSYSLPVVNLSGKYAVKLFWMGTQRKIIVDDTIPCDQNNLPLLPFTSRGNELWLPILTKAILKIASLHYCNNIINDLQDFHVVYCLLGWLPELIPLNEKYKDSIWKMLMQSLPVWKLPQSPIIVEHIVLDEKS